MQCICRTILARQTSLEASSGAQHNSRNAQRDRASRMLPYLTGRSTRSCWNGFTQDPMTAILRLFCP